MTLPGYPDYYHRTIEQHRIGLKQARVAQGWVRPAAFETWFRILDINNTNSSTALTVNSSSKRWHRCLSGLARLPVISACLVTWRLYSTRSRNAAQFAMTRSYWYENLL